MGNLGYRYVDNIQILPSYQIQQQIQRPFKGIQQHFQRIRRNIKIVRQFIKRRAVNPRNDRRQAYRFGRILIHILAHTQALAS